MWYFWSGLYICIVYIYDIVSSCSVLSFIIKIYLTANNWGSPWFRGHFIQTRYNICIPISIKHNHYNVVEQCVITCEMTAMPMVHQINRDNSLNLYIIDLLLIHYIHNSEGKKKKHNKKKSVRFRFDRIFPIAQSLRISFKFQQKRKNWTSILETNTLVNEMGNHHPSSL